MPAQELVGCNDQRSEARAASPWLIRGRCGASGGTGASSSRLLTFDFDVNTGSASRPQACAAHRPLQPGVVLLALNETKSFAGYLSPFPNIPHFAVARVLSRGMWGMRGMFLAGISIGILASSRLRHGNADYPNLFRTAFPAGNPSNHVNCV